MFKELIMIKLVVTLAVVIILASTIHPQNNAFTTSQIGSMNNTNIDQLGDSNDARVNH